jgi:hypothetical protein
MCDAVREQTPAISEQHDIAGAEFLDRAAMHDQDVARADGWKHTGAGDTQPYFAKATQHLGEQVRGGRLDQETFFAVRHWALVGLTLPQASAIVSKTCSRTNAGFS